MSGCNTDHSNCVLVDGGDGNRYHIVDPSPETTSAIARIDQELAQHYRALADFMAWVDPEGLIDCLGLSTPTNPLHTTEDPAVQPAEESA